VGYLRRFLLPLSTLLSASVIFGRGVAAEPAADYWTRFRGSDGMGIAVGAHPPTQWSESENLAWKTELPGPGASSPIRFGGNIFVTCYTGFATDGSSEGDIGKLVRHLICLDAITGKIRWDATVQGDAAEERYTRLSEHGYASHTPVTDGQQVYAFFGKSGVVAFDLSGKQRWHAEVGKESGRQVWGSAASLILYKNSVIVTAADESRSIRALDKATGKEIWKAAGELLENVYNTPALVTLPDGQQELVVSVKNEVWALNPDTGKLIWYATAPFESSMAASIVAADGIVYAAGDTRNPKLLAIRAGGKGDVTKTHVLWTSTRGPNYGTPVLHDGHLYYATERGVAICLDVKTGEPVYEERLRVSRGPAKVYASPILADGKLFITTRTAGSVILPANPAFEQLAENIIGDDDTDFSATPIICGNQILLRSNRALYCFTAAVGGGQ
jgi:outer membrane protein assembly factor BamB